MNKFWTFMFLGALVGIQLYNMKTDSLPTTTQENTTPEFSKKVTLNEPVVHSPEITEEVDLVNSVKIETDEAMPEPNAGTTRDSQLLNSTIANKLRIDQRYASMKKEKDDSAEDEPPQIHEIKALEDISTDDEKTNYILDRIGDESLSRSEKEFLFGYGMRLEDHSLIKTAVLKEFEKEVQTPDRESQKESNAYLVNLTNYYKDYARPDSDSHEELVNLIAQVEDKEVSKKLSEILVRTD